jgi:hypothetical protein
MDNYGIVLNGGDIGGLLKLAQSVQRWNYIENDLNTLKTVFNTWTPVPSDGGSALKTAIETWASEKLAVTVDSDVENVKVKQ